MCKGKSVTVFDFDNCLLLDFGKNYDLSMSNVILSYSLYFVELDVVSHELWPMIRMTMVHLLGALVCMACSA